MWQTMPFALKTIKAKKKEGRQGPGMQATVVHWHAQEHKKVLQYKYL